MGLVAPESAPERSRHSLDGCLYDLDGNVMLEATNIFDNPYFSRRNLEGNPEGVDIGMPEEPEGFFMYLTSKNAGWSTAAAQNTAPVNIDDPVYIFDTVQVSGHSPTTKSSAAPISPPLIPAYELVDTTRLGFKVALYKAFFTWVDRAGRHTPLSPPFPVNVTQINSYLIWDLPDNPPEEAHGIGLWLTRPGGDETTARLQKILTVDQIEALGGTYTMSGPWKKGKSMPNKNQTAPARPRKPTLHQSRGISPGVAGTYTVEVVFVHKNGSESGRSPVSNEQTITPEEAQNNVYLGVRYGDDAQNVRKRRGTYRRRDKKKEPRIDPDARYRIYVTADFGSGPEQYVLENRNKEGGLARPFIRGESTSFSGRTRESARPGEPLVLVPLEEAGVRNITETGTVKTITPKDDGLEKPDVPIDFVAAQVVTKLEPGDYRLGISYYVRGQETVPTVLPDTISVPSGKTIMVYLPDPINQLKNSQFTHLDVADMPFGWNLTGGKGAPNEGTYATGADGAFTLSTNGTKTLQSVVPQLWSDFPIDRSKVYAIGGSVTALMNSGRFACYLQQIDDSGNVIPASSTVLKNVTNSGQVDFVKTFGPAGSGYTQFHDSAVSGRLLLRFEPVNGVVNGIISILELFALLHSGRVRRYEEPDEPYAVDNTDPPPTAPWRRVNNKIVGPPPKSQPVFPSFSILSSNDFENGSLVTGLWQTRNSLPSSPEVSLQALTTAAVEGAYGARIKKTTASSAYAYLFRTDSLSTRQDQAARAKFRISRLPTRGLVTILQIKSTTGASDGHTGSLARVLLDNLGNLYVFETPAIGVATLRLISSGFRVGDILDLELIIRGAGTAGGRTFVAVGRNGSQRSYVYFSERFQNWSGRFARTAQIGPSGYTDPAAWIEMDVDTIHITTSGDLLTESFNAPALEALPFQDSPLDDPVYIDQPDFEGGTIPSPWSIVRDPVDSTTSVTVTGSAAIDGNFGLRCIDTSTIAIPSAAYIKRALVRDSVGFKFRMRPTLLPITGTVTIAQLVDASGGVVAQMYLQAVDSTQSDLYVQAVSATGPLSATKVAGGVTTATVITAEMMALGANTSSAGGTLSLWASTGGSGTRLERSLMGVPQSVDWTGKQIAEVRLGIISQSVPAVTANLSFDSIALSEGGEMIFVDTNPAGEEINQAYVFYPETQPVRDDLWLRGLRLAVKPGATYTVALWARHAGVMETSYPYFFTAYDLDGNPYPLGSLYGSSGALGTAGWQRLTQQFVIPDGCYEIRMDSRNIGGGEYVCQLLSVSPGSQVNVDVTYPDTGEAWAVLDSETPLPPPDAVLGAASGALENTWLALGTLTDVPVGTSITLEYGSTDELIEPSLWYAEPSLVTPRRYCHVRATFNSDSTNTLTPVWRSGSPFLEYATTLGGRLVPKVLREDGTEFPGGVYAMGAMFPRALSEYDFRRPQGRTRAHRKTTPIVKIGGFTMVAHSELASVEIEEGAHDGPFQLEVYGRRFKFNFVDEDIVFQFSDDPPNVLNPDTGDYFARMEADVSEVEVTEIAELPRLAFNGVLLNG